MLIKRTERQARRGTLAGALQSHSDGGLDRRAFLRPAEDALRIEGGDNLCLREARRLHYQFCHLIGRKLWHIARKFQPRVVRSRVKNLGFDRAGKDRANINVFGHQFRAQGFGKAGQRNPYEFGNDSTRPALQLDEAEVSFQAFVDPYAKANFFLSASPEGVEIEEGYAQFVTLPHDLTAVVARPLQGAVQVAAL